MGLADDLKLINLCKIFKVCTVRVHNCDIECSHFEISRAGSLYLQTSRNFLFIYLFIEESMN